MQIITGGKSKEQLASNSWEALVAASRQYRLHIDVAGLQFMLDQLNTLTAKTNYAFDLQQVVDGVIPPNVVPVLHDGHQTIHTIKVESTGPVIQAVLDKLPPSVRSGQDRRYAVYQIRLDDFGSWEHMMGTTTLLTVFLEDRDTVDGCYLMPDDLDSATNWNVLKDIHSEHFPQLGKGK